MGAIAKWVPFGGSFSGKAFQIGYGKGEVCQIRPDLHRPTNIILADLDLLLALRGFEKDELRSAPALTTTSLLKPQDIAVKMNGLFQIVNTITSVKELSNHALQMSVKSR